MRAFFTILVDSLRLLRARALFWVTLAISGLVATIYLSIGFTETGMSIFFGAQDFDHEFLRAGSPLAEVVYVGLFSRFIVGLWLSWIAIILALISCAPIFPDFMAEGSVGISLSKPVKRLTLFFYKYVGGLMFVALQVGLFCLIVFFAIRWRLGVWNFSVFWAVPVIVLIFSYLYSIVVLVAVRSRSVLAALLAALLVWFVASIGQKTEEALYTFSDPRNTALAGSEDTMKRWHRISVWVLAPLPKTSETANLLDRLIVVGGQRGFSQSSFIAGLSGMEFEDDGADQAVRRHSLGYVLGTSLAFEAVILGLAAWQFSRKDF